MAAGSAHSLRKCSLTSGITPRGAGRERRRRPWAPAGCQGNRASVLWTKLSPGLCGLPALLAVSLRRKRVRAPGVDQTTDWLCGLGLCDPQFLKCDNNRTFLVVSRED